MTDILDYQAKLKDVSSAFQSLALEALRNADVSYQAFTNEFQTDASDVTVGSYLGLPQMKEWVGERDFVAMRANAIAIEVKNYSKATKIERNRIVGDRLGEIGAALQEWLADIANDKMQLATQALLDGHSVACYDGSFLFATDHPNGPDGATSVNTDSNTLTRANVLTKKIRMINRQGENGRLFGVRPNIIMVGSALEDRAKDIVASMRTQGLAADGTLDGGTRIAGTAIPQSLDLQIVVNPYLVGTSAFYWFLLDSTRAAKPIIMPVLIDARPRDDAADPFPSTPDARFSVDLHVGFGGGAWQVADSSTATS